MNVVSVVQPVYKVHTAKAHGDDDDTMKNEYQLDLFDFIIHKLSPFVSPDLVYFSPIGMRLRPSLN